MRQQLRVTISAETGLPFAMVPSSAMWDLVEYLSYQRVAVSYEYRATHFTVCFLRIDQDAAQRLLDEWTRSPSQLAEVG